MRPRIVTTEEPYAGRVGDLTSEWLLGIPNGLGYLRERQWLRLSPAGFILVLPPCFERSTA